ncbi:MAG: hypothetical protein J7501_00045 [Bdellovibrio sp.]|nr:hypothetical protein [Bdellovibrio sp.]
MSLVIFAILFFTGIFCWGKTSPWESTLGVDLRYEGKYFPQEFGGDETNANIQLIDIIPYYRVKYKDSWRFLIKPTLEASPGNKSSEEQFWADPTEAYVQWKRDPLAVQVGYNLVTWGVTDGYNPVDVINPKQYFDPMHSKKKGVLSLMISESLAWFDYDLYYIPINSGATLPGEESRWLPREVYIPYDPANNTVLILPPNLRYHYGDTTNLEDALNNNFGLRLQKHLGPVDLAVSGYEGAASFPIIQPVFTGTIVQVSPKIVVDVDPDVILNRFNYKVRQGGFSFVSSQWDFLFKYQTSYSQSVGDNSLLPGWLHENVAALEKTFQIPDGMFIAVLQYSFLNSEKQNDSNVSVTEIFRRAWMLGMKMQWREVWSFGALGLYDERHGSSLQEYSIGRRFLDTMTVSLTADLFDGPSDTPLGVYNKNDSYSLAVSASF